MEVNVRTSIVSSYNLCIQSFDRLRRILEQPESEYATELPPSALKDQEGRFRIWAGNSGAHRSGRVSLDYKLREASHVHDKVIDLLGDLNRALQEAISITTNENRSENDSASDASSSDSESDTSTDSGIEGPAEDLPTTTELEYTLLDITHVITCLYKFSLALRQPAPRDRLHKYAKINVSHYQLFDVKHAEEKFKGAAPYLLERLGRANTRRRQLLKYHQQHHDKIARYVDLPLVSETHADDELDAHGVSGAEATQALVASYPEMVDPQSFALSKPGPATLATTMNTQTTVTTVKFAPKNLDDIEAESDTGQSQTSFATSASGDKDWKIRVPPPPDADASLDGNPFQCPYCFTVIIVHSSRSWMRHVMRDLKAYICTFENCAKPDQLFEHRNEWYEHEMQFHRRQWVCDGCNKTFHARKDIQSHLKAAHSDLFIDSQIPAMVERCERTDTSDQQCPLCTEVMSPQRLKGHLARHLQQLALFVLPRNHTTRDDKDAQSDNAQVSTRFEEDGSRSSQSTKEDLDFVSNPSRASSYENPESSKASVEGENGDGLHDTKDSQYDLNTSEVSDRGDVTESGASHVVADSEAFSNIGTNVTLSEHGNSIQGATMNGPDNSEFFSTLPVATLMVGKTHEFCLELLAALDYRMQNSKDALPHDHKSDGPYAYPHVEVANANPSTVEAEPVNIKEQLDDFMKYSLANVALGNQDPYPMIQERFLDSSLSGKDEDKYVLFAYLEAWGNLLAARDRFQEAIALFDRIIDDFDSETDLENLSSIDRLRTVERPFNAAQRVAKIYKDIGDYEKALVRYEWLLDHITNTSIIPFDTWQVFAREMVAVYQLKDPETAKHDCLRIYETLFNEATRRFGESPGHPAILQCERAIALQLRECGELERAAERFKAIIETRKSFPSGIQDITRDTEDLADTYVQMYESAQLSDDQNFYLTEAENLYREIVDGSQIGQDLSRLDAMWKLSKVLYKHSETFNEALELRKKVYSTRQVIQGSDHPDTLKALTGLTLGLESSLVLENSGLGDIYRTLIDLHTKYPIR